jgi:hypothetical protein
MIELMGRLVTDKGAEAAAVRATVDANLALPLKDDQADSLRAAIDVLPGIGGTIPATRHNTGFGGMLGVMGAEWRRI